MASVKICAVCTATLSVGGFFGSPAINAPQGRFHHQGFALRDLMLPVFGKETGRRL